MRENSNALKKEKLVTSTISNCDLQLILWLLSKEMVKPSKKSSKSKRIRTEESNSWYPGINIWISLKRTITFREEKVDINRDTGSLHIS